jgi:hypothetical protein
MDRLTSTNDYYLMDEYLREVDSRTMIPAYINALESNRIYAGTPIDDEHVRDRFIFQLGRLKARQAVPVLLKLCSEDYPLHRHEAVRALGEIRSPDAVPALIGFLKEKITPGSIHEETVIALFQARDRRAAQALGEYLTKPGVGLEHVAFSFGSAVFPDFARKFNTERMDFETQGTPVEILSRLSRHSGIPIHLKLPNTGATAANAPMLPIMTMSKGQPMEGWIVTSMNNLSEVYKTPFAYLIGDDEVFLVPNTELSTVLLAVFDKMTDPK